MWLSKIQIRQSEICRGSGKTKKVDMINSDSIDTCLCLHQRRMHMWDSGPCYVNLRPWNVCQCKRFKLDNLSYIEKLATKRGLV